MNYVALRSFLKKFDDYSPKEQEVITQTIEEIKNHIETNRAAYGLRIKRLSSRLYEGRINIHLRIAYYRDRETVKFFCLGNHDDIQRCLKTIGRHL